MIEDCTALVMAGGQSQRMGSDKASLLLGEHTLLDRVLTVVQPLFPHVLVSVREPRPDIAQTQICDAYPNAGPLAGLCAGLRAVQTPWLFAVATDMPFVQAALIERLAAMRSSGDRRAQAAVPMVGGHPQPLAAFYAKECLPEVEALLQCDGRRSLRAVLDQLSVCYVDEADLRAADPGLRSFFDLDTPHDLAVALSERSDT